MAGDKIEVLLVGPPKPTIVNGLASLTLHRLDAKDRDALLKEIGGRVRWLREILRSKQCPMRLRRGRLWSRTSSRRSSTRPHCFIC